VSAAIVVRRGRFPLLPAALAAVAVAAAAVIALAWHGSGGGGPARGPAAAVSVQGTASQPAPELPVLDLGGLTWHSFHGVMLPSSPAAGPRDTAGGTAAGFSDTPLGALVAAVNIGIRANAQWGPGIFGPEIRRDVTGPSAAQLLADCQAGYASQAKADGISGGQPLGSVTVTVRAFRWIAWTPAAALLDLVSAGPGSQGGTVMASAQLEVIWEHGDWRLVAPPGGDFGNSAAVLTSLAGYTVFAGQG
jgi:hypothetical protein